jgi:hypothetical protein
MFREETDVAFHESVAREHLEQHMPVIELHRNHGIPLAAVTKWIAIYQAGGRPALEVAAEDIARRYTRPLSSKQLAQLAEKLRSREPDAVGAALVTVSCRRVHALTNAVFDVLSKPHAGQVIEALITLGDLGAASHLDRAEQMLAPGYKGWINGARQRMPKQRS